MAVVYITSIKTRNTPFSTMIGSTYLYIFIFIIDNLIDILKSFPTGEEKEKLISAFTQYTFCKRLTVDGVNPLEMHLLDIPS